MLVQVRLLCNLFDGMAAVLQGQTSAVGEMYNEIPDRVSDAAIFIGLGYASCGDGTGTVPELGYVAALVAIFAAYVRAVGKAGGAPNDFCGPFAKPQRMAIVTLFAIYIAASPTSWRSEFGDVRILLIVVIAGTSLTTLRRLGRIAAKLRADPPGPTE